MALTLDNTGYYLDSGTGQYYTPYTAPKPAPFYGAASMLVNPTPTAKPKGIITVDGKTYKPFEGNTALISEGKRSMVQELINRANQAVPNVPTLSQMFPGLTTQVEMPVTPIQGSVYQQPLQQSSNQYFAPWAVNKKGVSLAPEKQPSMADVLINRANNAYVAPPTAAQLFPGISYNATPMTDTGSYGAGRFTGGLLGKA